MRVLLDTCLCAHAATELRSANHDVEWIGEWPEDPGDRAILAYAFSEKRVLVTLDKDFGEIAILWGEPHYGILRLVNFSALQQGMICIDVLDRYGDELLAGAVVTVEPGRLRVRPPDSQ